jgi:hypothetical protein
LKANSFVRISRITELIPSSHRDLNLVSLISTIRVVDPTNPKTKVKSVPQLGHAHPTDPFRYPTDPRKNDGSA